MAVWNEINITHVQTAHRIDAEFFRPEYEALDDVFAKLGVVDTIGKLANFVKKGIFDISPSRYRNEGIPLIRTFQIKSPISNEENLVFISAQDHRTYFSKTELRSGDLLFTKIGAGIGDVSLLSKKHDRYNFSQNVAGLSVKREKVDPYFLLAFLISKYGRRQTIRYMMPSGQGKLELKDIKKIYVARFDHSEQEIASMVTTSEELAEKSANCCQKAQQLLESELGLDKIRFQKPVGYTARLSEAMTGGRIDADYLQPQYGAVRALVQAYPGGYEPLLNCTDSLRPNIDPSKAPNHLFNYIELSNINASLGIVEGFLPSIGANLPSRAKRQVKTGDVIASAVVGSVDKAAIIAEEQNGFLASTGFFHLRPKSISPMYLLMLARSQCVRMQFQQQSTGGILSAVPDSRLKHVIIPKLPVALQEEIDSLVTKSHSAKHASDVLLDQAKTRVEQLIEEAVKS